MCGRYAVTLPPETFRALFGYAEQPNFPPRFNVAPTQPVAVVTAERGERHFRLVRWGFLPGWVKDSKAFPLLFNARGETLDAKAAFRNAFRRRRCIFLADGFYEWQRRGRDKAAFLVRMGDRGPMPLAGLWETYADPSGGEIDTAAVVTTDANGLLAAIHDRMPVILSREGVDAWLDVDSVSPAQALRLVRPCPEAWLDLVPVGPRVNSVANDDADLQVPVAVSSPPSERSAKPPAGEDPQGRLL